MLSFSKLSYAFTSRTFKRVLILCLCLFCLQACSTKMAYNFLGFVFKWYVGNYVSLDREQKSLLNERVRDFHAWHRETQLPLYADYIAGLMQRMGNEEITGEWIHKETDEVQLLVDNSVNYLKPGIVELVASFDDEQAEELLASFAKNREKYQKKYVEVSREKLAKRRKNDLKDSLGPFFGSFSKEQKNWIEAWANELKPYETLTLRQQEIWANKLRDALAVRDDPEKLSRKLDEVMFYRTDDWQPELEQILDHNQEISYQLIAKLINNQSQKQRAKMLRKLGNYQDDFIDLAGLES